MIRRIFILLIFLPFLGWSQLGEIGINGGLGIVTIRSDVMSTFPGGGVNMGIMGRYNFQENVSIYFNPGMEYRSRTLQANTTVPGGFSIVESVRFQTSSVSLPVMLNYHIGNRFRFEGNVGGYYNYTIRQKQQASFFGGFNPQQPFMQSEMTEDAGFIVGIGFSSRFSEFCSLHFEFRNYIGMRDLAPDLMNFSRSENFHVVMLGFCFPIDRTYR